MGTTSSSPVVLGAIPRIPDEIVAETYFRFMPGELRTELMHFVVNNGYAPPQLGFAPPVLSQFLPSTIYILGYIGEKFCAGLGAPQPGIYAIDFRTGDTCRLIALQSEAMLHTTFGLTGQRQLRSTRITIAADRLVYGNKRTIHCLDINNREEKQYSVPVDVLYLVSMACSPDWVFISSRGQKGVSANGSPKKTIIWDVAKAALVQEWNDAYGPFSSLQLAPDRHLVGMIEKCGGPNRGWKVFVVETKELIFSCRQYLTLFSPTLAIHLERSVLSFQSLEEPDKERKVIASVSGKQRAHTLLNDCLVVVQEDRVWLVYGPQRETRIWRPHDISGVLRVICAKRSGLLITYVDVRVRNSLRSVEMKLWNVASLQCLFVARLEDSFILAANVNQSLTRISVTVVNPAKNKRWLYVWPLVVEKPDAKWIIEKGGQD